MMWRTTVTSTATLVLTCSMGLASAAPDAPDSPDRTYLVRLAPGASPTEASAAVRATGGRVEHTVTHVFAGAVARLDDRAVAALTRNPRVLSVEPDEAVSVAGSQPAASWGLDRSDQRTLPLDGTFTASADGTGVTAYVLDTGIRADHTDFAGRVSAGFTVVADGRGTQDCNGHGTHVAGTVGGARHGVAADVRVVPVRVLDCSGAGTVSGIVRGLDWVVGQHALGTPAVLNLSLSAAASDTLDAAVAATVSDGVSVVVAAGNSAHDACATSPARVHEALTVGALDATDTRAAFSNSGTCLDVFAPGTDIVSAWNTTSTATASLNGTSMAAPHVAGAVAALLEAAPALPPADVSQRLLTAASAGPVLDAGQGSPQRILYADPALAPAAPTAPQPPTAVTGSAGRRSASISWTRGHDGGSPLTGHRVHAFSPAGLVSTLEVPGTASAATVTGLKPGTAYTFTVRARNALGTSLESARSNTVVPTR